MASVGGQQGFDPLAQLGVAAVGAVQNASRDAVGVAKAAEKKLFDLAEISRHDLGLVEQFTRNPTGAFLATRRIRSLP